MERRDSEQLNSAPKASEELRLDDILREFGSEKEPPKEGVSSDTMAFQPLHSVPPKAGTEEPIKIFEGKAKSKAAPPSSKAAVSGDTQPLPVVKDIVVKPPKKSASSKRPGREQKQTGTQRLLQKYSSGLVGQYVRLYCSGLVSVAALLHLLYQKLLPGSLPFLDSIQPWLSVLLLAVTACLVPEVFVRGIMDLIHLRISSHTLAALAGVLAPLQALTTASRFGHSYCEVAAILLFFQYLAILLGRSAMTKTLRTVCSFDKPMGIFEAPQLLEHTDSLRREKANLEDYAQKLIQPDLPQRVMSVHATILLPLSLILALLATTRSDTDFLTLWLLNLLCTVPFAGAMSFVAPFRYLARRLSAFNGALCGWHSAETFGSSHTIILRDEDLFPAGSVASNGMKLFNGHNGTRVTGYALAALEVAESPLAALFRSLLPKNSGGRYAVTESRIYDNCGVGVAIGPDIVLVGTLAFARSMGVHMPGGTRVRHAVYVSINGELAGIFAIRYKPNDSSRAGLRDILANRNFSVVLATRDFLIGPELIASKYELPTDAIIYPDYGERLRLSAIDPTKPAEQGGLIAKDTFGAFATTVAAGRTLRITSLTAMLLSLLAGALGLLMSILLLVWDAAASATPLYILAFQLLWAAITGLVSIVLLKL